jgi:hypothetical protein
VFYFPVMGYEYEQFHVWDMNMKISCMGYEYENFPWENKTHHKSANINCCIMNV